MRFITTLLSGVLLLGIMAGGFVLPTHANEAVGLRSTGPVIYFTSLQFPYVGLGQVPPDAEDKTEFMAALYQTLQNESGITLINQPNGADYEVRLRCTGITACSTLMLDFYNPDGLFLSRLKLPGHKNPFVKADPLEYVSRIATGLASHLTAIQQGQYGAYEAAPFE